MKTIYALAFIIFSNSSQAACPAEWFPLYCRGGGGFTLKNTYQAGVIGNSDLGARFKKSPDPYSTVGGGIQPGSCTWYDRIISEGEPSEFLLPVHLVIMGTVVSMNLITQCAPNSDCWMNLCAKHVVGVNFLSIFGVEVSTSYGEPPPPP